MKLNRLETHDRLNHFKEDQSLNIFKGAEECLKKNRLSIGLQQYSPYIYIYVHSREIGFDERLALFKTGLYKSFEEVPKERIIWQPRLTKGPCNSNSYLFRAISNTDEMDICWMLPKKELWGQEKKEMLQKTNLLIGV